MVDSLLEGLNLVEGALTKLLTPLQDLKNWLQTIYEYLRDYFNPILQDVKSFFTNIYDFLYDKFNPILQDVKDFFTDIYEYLKDFFNPMLDTLKDAFQNIKDVDVGKWFQDLVSKVKGWFD